MHLVEEAETLRDTDSFGPRALVDEKAADEERFRVARAVLIPVKEIDDATAMASIATSD
jgi:hypothetical protein